MKINYDLKFKEELKKIGNTRPTLLLHVCCGPCSSNVLKEICNLFDITIYYSNSNIYPSEEYYRRYHELLDFITRFNNDFNQNITVIENRYTLPVAYAVDDDIAAFTTKIKRRLKHRMILSVWPQGLVIGMRLRAWLRIS